jgi:hypothetical protein
MRAENPAEILKERNRAQQFGSITGIIIFVFTTLSIDLRTARRSASSQEFPNRNSRILRPCLRNVSHVCFFLLMKTWTADDRNEQNISRGTRIGLRACTTALWYNSAAACVRCVCPGGGCGAVRLQPAWPAGIACVACGLLAACISACCCMHALMLCCCCCCAAAIWAHIRTAAALLLPLALALLPEGPQMSDGARRGWIRRRPCA